MRAVGTRHPLRFGSGWLVIYFSIGSIRYCFFKVGIGRGLHPLSKLCRRVFEAESFSFRHCVEPLDQNPADRAFLTQP